jgi:hypothetical protein
MTYARNYHKPAVKPPAPPRTREAIASRNRCAAAISAALGVPFPILNARGQAERVKRAAA